MKRTALFDEHVRAGAKIVDFGGWEMPVQYSGIMDEHKTVRSAVGVFDISHMGEVFVSGTGAAAWLNSLLTNQIDRLGIGQGQYTFMLNEQGGVIDDLIVYRLSGTDYLLIVNASKIEEDVAWLEAHREDGVVLDNRSSAYAGLAVQGPKAAALFQEFFAGATLPERNHVATVERDGVSYLVARTGYTGEDGFELFFEGTAAPRTWQALLTEGSPLGIKPCGLGARDTLRLEMCYPLNGSDLSPSHSPLEAGMAFFVDLEKGPFIGRDILLAQKAEGLKVRLVPFKMTGKTPPPRSHYPVLIDGIVVAETASGSLSPSLETGIGMAYLPAEKAKAGQAIEIDIRGRRFPAVIEKNPFIANPELS